jgi:hypothetical protein
MAPTTVRSPFYIIEDAISPLQCEALVDDVEFLSHDVDASGRQIDTHKVSDTATDLIHDVLEDHREGIEAYYNRKITFMDKTRVVWSSSEVDIQLPWCDNSVRMKDKWLRVHNRDLTAVLFCSDFNDKPPFDSDFEVYGGKMEFPSHGFGFNPVRGTIVIMPSDPHFTHVFSKIAAGDLYLCKTFLATDPPLIYTPKDFPGTWQQWLSGNF